jgi:hypothetical protein
LSFMLRRQFAIFNDVSLCSPEQTSERLATSVLMAGKRSFKGLLIEKSSEVIETSKFREPMTLRKKSEDR